MGVRPNSPPQITSVSSSRPRRLRSFTSAALGLSVSLQFFFRSATRLPCWSHDSWNSSTKRTPRSTNRRARRQLLAKEDLPGSAPYISSTSFGSLEMSINSGAEPGKSSFANNCRSEEHTSELQSLAYLVCRLLLEKKK